MKRKTDDSTAPTPAGAGLLPCPFCGSSPRFVWSFGSLGVECNGCGTRKGPEDCTDEGTMRATATANWNTRRPVAAAAAGPGEGRWVPLEPTNTMMNAAPDAWHAWKAQDNGGSVQDLGCRIYRAMLEAAPPQPETPAHSSAARPDEITHTDDASRYFNPTFGHDDLPLLDTPEKIKEWLDEKPILKARLGEQPAPQPGISREEIMARVNSPDHVCKSEQPGSKADEPVAEVYQGGDLRWLDEKFRLLADGTKLYSTPQPTPHQPAAALMELARKFAESAKFYRREAGVAEGEPFHRKDAYKSYATIYEGCAAEAERAAASAQEAKNAKD